MITLVVLVTLMLALTTEAASLEKREPELDPDVIFLSKTFQNLQNSNMINK